MSVLRALAPDDAGALRDLWAADREHLDPWSPARPGHFFTVDGQRELVEQRLEAAAEDRGAFFVVVDAAGEVVGEVNLTDVVRARSRTGTSATGSRRVRRAGA